MTRLVIHAGFPKCGSSSIQCAIGQDLELLERQSIFLMGEELKIGRGGVHPRLPLWTFERESAVDTVGYSLTPRMLDTIDQLSREVENPTVVITSENLSQKSKARLFAGIDERLDVEVVFYLRPQCEWIPSAWKQWVLKAGTPLDRFVATCIQRGNPEFLASIETWERTLPNARITVRLLVRELMLGGNPADDFFQLLGVSAGTTRIVGPINASIDYSLLHVMARAARDLFTGIHDNGVSDALAAALPAAYRKTNIAMLSNEMAARVTERFHKENMTILEKYCGGYGVPAAKLYEEHFVPKPEPITYMDVDEIEVLCRCLGVLYEQEEFRPLIYKALGGLLKDVASMPKATGAEQDAGGRVV